MSTVMPEWAEIIEKKAGCSFFLLNYAFHLFPEYKLTYVEIPKNGCTSVKKILYLALLDQELKGRNIHETFYRQLPRISKLGSKITNEGLFGSYFRFAVTRNPVERIISGFNDKIIGNEHELLRIRPKFNLPLNKNISFTNFLEKVAETQDHDRDIHFMSQSKILNLDNINYDLMFDINLIETEMRKILNMFQVEMLDNIRLALTTRHNQNTGKNTLPISISNTQLGLIKSIYEEDFERLKYSIKRAKK